MGTRDPLGNPIKILGIPWISAPSRTGGVGGGATSTATSRLMLRKPDQISGLVELIVLFTPLDWTQDCTCY